MRDETKEARYLAANPDQFWRHVLANPVTGCWHWQGKNNGVGYGRLQYRGRNWLAHRLSYTMEKGEIPSHLEIDHVCRNTLCVNPDHLEAVTHRENVVRGRVPEVMRARGAARTHCKHGHEYSEANTIRSKTGRSCRTCNREQKRASRRGVKIPRTLDETQGPGIV